ncbi:MAG: V-type ATPase subunit [Actinobacteria bacterium]|nr:MAG: V-type ATPase subunit [Actinomycetota bacterium]
MTAKAPMLRATRETIRYGFASGKAKVLSQRVFGRSTFERLLDAPSFGEQVRVLSDTPYGRHLEGVDTAEGVERAMIEALDGFYGFLAEAALPEPVVRFFRVRHDFGAMRAAWKARAVGAAYEPPPHSLGTVDAAVFSAPPQDWPEPFASVAAEAARAAEADAGALDARAIDAAVDRALFAEMAECARASRSEFLSGLVAHLADLANARALVRSRAAGRAAAEVEAGLVPGGAARASALMEWYALPAADLAARLAASPSLAGVSAADLLDPARMDVAGDDAVARHLRRAHAVPVGAEPVIAYVLTREAEVAAVRTMLLGRLAGLNADVLRARLRETQGAAR